MLPILSQGTNHARRGIASRTACGAVGESAPTRRCEARRAGTCHLHRLSNAANDQLTNAGPCQLVRIRADPKTGDAKRVKQAPARRAGALKVQRRNIAHSYDARVDLWRNQS